MLGVGTPGSLFWSFGPPLIAMLFGTLRQCSFAYFRVTFDVEYRFHKEMGLQPFEGLRECVCASFPLRDSGQTLLAEVSPASDPSFS